MQFIPLRWIVSLTVLKFPVFQITVKNILGESIELGFTDEVSLNDFITKWKDADKSFFTALVAAPPPVEDEEIILDAKPPEEEVINA